MDANIEIKADRIYHKVGQESGKQSFTRMHLVGHSNAHQIIYVRRGLISALVFFLHLIEHSLFNNGCQCKVRQLNSFFN